MNSGSLKDFLKKYSTLSNDFIDDFYSIYNFYKVVVEEPMFGFAHPQII